MLADVSWVVWFNPLFHRLFLDHDIIFYYLTTLKIFNKNLSKVRIFLKKLWKMEHSLLGANARFSIIFSNT